LSLWSASESCLSAFLTAIFFPLGVKAGGDRQELHELIRVHSMSAGAVVKGEGKPNDLMERIAKDPAFAAVHFKLDSMIDPKLFVGRAPQQVDEFISDEVDPVLAENTDLLAVANVDDINV
jgi:adenylosuccinate lyase